MTKPVKKKKSRAKQIEEIFDPKAQKKAERRISDRLMELDELAEEREKFSSVILKANDSDALEAVRQMTEQLRVMQGIPRLVIDGRYVPLKAEEQHMLQTIQDRNFRWIAVRCLVALAEWDIQVAGFKLPKKSCARCGRKLK